MLEHKLIVFVSITHIHINVCAKFDIDIFIHMRDTEISYLTRACLVSVQSPGRGETRHVSRIARHNEAADYEEERVLFHTSIAM